jgi:uncharacterized protein (TIGR03083 family)
MRPLDVLERCWVLWAEVLGDLAPAQWTAPTRSSGWDVKALATHHAGWVLGFAGLPAHPADPSAPTTTAVELLRGFNVPGGVAAASAAEIEARTREFAAALATEQIVATFADAGPAAVAAARDVTTPVDYLGLGALPVDEVATIGVVEATVHGLDLLDAVGVAPERIPGPAQELVTAVLVALPGRLAFIEGATGRRAVFPVLR